MIIDTYRTIKGERIGEYKEKGSKFIAYARAVFDENDVHAFLSEIKKLHPKARHHCYSYRLGLDKNNYRANDDGEPSGTAGRPILGQIDSFELTNTMVIVVRYFGGTKLGVPGLIKAYKDSTEDALKKAEIISKKVKKRLSLQFGYELMSNVMNAIKKHDIEIAEQNFENTAQVIIALPLSEVEDKLLRMRCSIAQCHPEEEDKWKHIAGLEIEEL